MQMEDIVKICLLQVVNISSEDMLKSTSDPTGLNHLELSGTIVSANAQRTNIVIDSALSNSLILRNIFLMMDDEDLSVTRQVNKCWRTVTDLMVSHYDIQIGRFRFLDCPMETDYVLVKKRDRANRRSFIEFETNFEGVKKILKEDTQRYKISISLKLGFHVDIWNGRGKDFLSNFGHLVVDLDFVKGRQGPVPLNSFCKIILEDLPNLRELNFSQLRFEENSLEDEMFNPDLPQNVQRKLTKISFSPYENVPSIGNILKIFPNLEKIEKMPLYLIESVERAEKIHALKSLSDSYNSFRQAEFTDETTFEKLARLQPKLTSFREISSDFLHHICFFKVDPRKVRSSVYSILQSSSESLKSLTMYAQGSSGIQEIPKMTGLKSLELHYPFVPASERTSSEFFTRYPAFEDIFPNVSDFHLECEIYKQEFSRYLPARVFSPWGSQIKVLGLKQVDPDILPRLQSLFPNIQKLQLRHSSEMIAEIMLQLPFTWPDLKSLTIDIGLPSKPTDLDWAFTGISEEVAGQLLDPATRVSFTDAEIQSLKDQSIICKLKGLRELKLLFGNYVPFGGMSMRTRLTPVSNEFGFGLLQELKVTVKIWTHNRNFEALKKELESLARSDKIEIIDCGDIERT